MSDPARIGPNAVLQYLPVIAALGGDDMSAELLGRAGLSEPPSDRGLMPETSAARFHHAVRRAFPARAPDLAADAGRRTGDYILAHRIPRAAQLVLRLLPARAAAPILSRAILHHAWTFAGSGHVTLVAGRPVTFDIAGNPMILGERGTEPLCHWHAAVFARLYAALVHPNATCTETQCAAADDPVCRFQIDWR